MDDDILDELEEAFNRAAAVVQEATTSGNGKQLSQDVMLNIYGLYKTATIGKCTDPKPGIFDPRGRAKWTAWTSSSKLSKEEAMTQYISLISANYNWDPSQSSDKRSGNSSTFGGNAVSSFPVPVEQDTQNEPETLIFQWIKENDLEKVATWIKQSSNTVNFQDDDGLTLLHWAVDRGHLETTKLLLDHNADPSIPDHEGLTPLDYAVTCEHEAIVSLLQSNTLTQSPPAPE